MMRKLAVAALALLAALAPAMAQVPNFPQTLPADTLVGRLGVGSGPSQAIPITSITSRISNCEQVSLNATAGTDNGPAIGRAIAAAAASGRNCVQLPVGIYDVGPVTISTSNITIQCAARSNPYFDGGTRLRALTATTTMFTVTFASNVYFKDCAWVPYGYTTAAAYRTALATPASTPQQTAGSYVKFSTTSYTAGLENWFMIGPYYGVELEDNANELTFKDGRIRDFVKAGVYANVPSAGAHIFDGIIMDTVHVSGNDACFYVRKHGGDLQIRSGLLFHCHHGVWLNPGLGEYVIWPKVSMSSIDSCDDTYLQANQRGGTGINVTPHGGGLVRGGEFSDIWIGSCDRAIALIADSTATGEGELAKLDGLKFTNIHAVNNFREALRTDYATNLSLVNPYFAGNGHLANNTYDSIYIGAHTLQISFFGGHVGNPAGGYPTTSVTGQPNYPYSTYNTRYSVTLESGFNGVFQWSGAFLYPGATGTWNVSGATLVEGSFCTGYGCPGGFGQDVWGDLTVTSKIAAGAQATGTVAGDITAARSATGGFVYFGSNGSHAFGYNGTNWVMSGAAQGDLIYGSAAATLSLLPKDTGVSRFLKNSGTSNNPAWAQPAASDLSNGTTGSGAVVLQTSPTIKTPTIGGSPDAYAALTPDAGGGSYRLISTGTAGGGQSAADGSLLAAAGSFGIEDMTANLVRLAITSGGNVGIGTATPGTFLQVGDGTTPLALTGIRLATGGNNYYTVSDNTRQALFGVDTNGGMVGTYTAHKFALRYQNIDQISLTANTSTGITFNNYGAGVLTTNGSGVVSAATTSAAIASALSDETGTGALVFADSPAFATKITTPKIIGGSGTTGAQLTFQTTTGVGSGEYFEWKGGNNGATSFGVLSTNGFIAAGQVCAVNCATGASTGEITTGVAADIGRVWFGTSGSHAISYNGQYLFDGGALPVNGGGTGYAVLPARSTSSPADPTGTTSATAVMMGLAGSVTPTTSGKVNLTMSGIATNATGGESCQLRMRYGTGAAPANGAAASGTTTGGAINYTSATANAYVPFSVSSYITGLTPSTAYWLDMSLLQISGGTCNLYSVTIVATEVL